MKKLIIGLTGQMGSGKTTVATYLKERYSASTYRFSTMLRDVLDRLYIEKTREHLQKISTAVRELYGEDTMAKVMAKDVESDENNIIIVDGVRRPDDVKYLKELPGFVLLTVTADIETRFERISARNENPDDQQKTLESFKKEHEGEPERKIDEVSESADVTIDNNGTQEALYAQVEALLEKYGDQS